MFWILVWSKVILAINWLWQLGQHNHDIHVAVHKLTTLFLLNILGSTVLAVYSIFHYKHCFASLLGISGKYFRIVYSSHHTLSKNGDINCCKIRLVSQLEIMQMFTDQFCHKLNWQRHMVSVYHFKNLDVCLQYIH